MKTYIKPAIEEMDIDLESMIATSPTGSITIDNSNQADEQYEVLTKDRDTYSLWD